MIPSPDDVMMQLPLTLDYKGGRSEGSKTKWILLIVFVVIAIIVSIASITNKSLATWQRWVFALSFDYIVMIFLRFFAFKETYYSDIYETLKETKNELPAERLWDIFDIDWEYPYIVYFRNGRKGIFVRMEKDAIVGKGATAKYNHYEAISDAYNLAHSLKMDIRHIDYMDNVGNDSRLLLLYDQLKSVQNPDMSDMLLAMYQNLEEEMSRNYASFDIYLYLTRDKTETFIYNVQAVSNAMLGGNFITYRVLNRDDIRGVVVALFNLHTFNITDACEAVLNIEENEEIIPIRVLHSNGEVERLNETAEERRVRKEIEQSKIVETEKKKGLKNIKIGKKKKQEEAVVFDDNDDWDLF